MYAMYIASYGYFLNWGYIHHDIIMDLIVGLDIYLESVSLAIDSTQRQQPIIISI